MEHNKHKWVTIRIKFSRLLTCFYDFRWTRKGVKISKNGKTPAQDNINSELYKYAPEEFKLRLLQFLNNTRIYRENRIPNEWRNAVITFIAPIFKKDDRREPKKYRGISILNTCYKIYCISRPIWRTVIFSLEILEKVMMNVFEI